jgi:hypothetical protein
MEWCLNCHRNPAVNLRPTAEIYNMAWAGPSSDKPVWCAPTGTAGPTAQQVGCVTSDPSAGNPQVAQLSDPTGLGKAQTVAAVPPAVTLPANYVRFTSQDELGHYLMKQYHIRTANELSSCEVCHR